MAQYNPQAQQQQPPPQQQQQGGGGDGGRGRGGNGGRGGYQGGRNPSGGRGGPQQGGRGGPQQGGRGGPQQGGRGGPQQGGRGGPQQQGRPMGAWQPSAPTSSLQQAAYGRQQQQPPQPGYHPQHQQQQQHPGQHPGQHPNQHQQHPGQYAQNMQHYNPYAAQQAQYRGGQGPPGGQGGWQQQTGYTPQGGVYYPPQGGQQGGAPAAGAPPAAAATNAAAATGAAAAAATPAAPAAPAVVVPKPREKKPLVITDKDGNVLDFRSVKKAPSSLKAAVAETAKPAKADAAATPAAAVEKSDAGAKLREAALASLKKDTKGKDAKKPEEKAAAPAKAVPAKAKEEKKVPEVKALAKTLADVAAAPAPAKPLSAAAAVKSGGSSLAAASKKPNMAAIAAAPAPVAPKSVGGALRPGGAKAGSSGESGRLVYDKAALMKLKKTESCMKKPDSLPDMTIVKGPAKQQGGGGGNRRGSGGGGGGNGGGGGGNWDRGKSQPKNQNRQNNNNGGGGGNWDRGQAPPRNQQKGGNNNGRRGSQNNGQQPLLEGPVAPLVISENRWKPGKDKNPLAVAEKTVKGILNKMTKERFDILAGQMCDIQILSYDMLVMIIHNVYEKAIDEPIFGEMYADLCVRLSAGAAQVNNDFVKLIESDEEPPTEGEEAPSSQQQASSSSHVVYRWSNDVSTTDSEIVGPFTSADECIDAALSDSSTPEERGETVLELFKLVIRQGIFIKVLKKKDEDVFYTVYFSVSEAEECGQQMSEIFLSEVESISNAKKKNSFKRSLLNKCEDEFKKQDIYVDWKKDNKEFEETKSTLTPKDAKEQESDLNFRRIKIKKQMLGNIKFIGQLYKKGLLKEKIMRFCIGSLLKLEELEIKSKNPEYKDTGDMDMDAEDHEAICSMFTTIGNTIDKTAAADFMKVCFTKVKLLSHDKKKLPARSRFMYKDLLELRDNRWVPRRDEGKAKTLEEIRKDVEKEEKKQAAITQQNYRDDRNNNGGNNRRGSQQGGGYDNRRGGNNFGGRGGSGGNDNRGSGGGGGNRNRRESAKPQMVTDDDGFTVIASSRAPNAPAAPASPKSKDKKQPAAKSGSDKKPSSSAPAPFTKEKLERRIKSMRTEFMQDPSNTAELFLSMDELSGTDNAGATFVSQSADAFMECKEAERKAVTEVIRLLYLEKKLTNDEIQSGLAEFLEFIDSMICDCPKLFEYVGDLMAVLFEAKALNVQWYADTVEKIKAGDAETSAPDKLTRAIIGGIRNNGDTSVAKEIFGSSDSVMNGLMGADKWKSISNDLLA